MCVCCLIICSHEGRFSLHSTEQPELTIHLLHGLVPCYKVIELLHRVEVERECHLRVKPVEGDLLRRLFVEFIVILTQYLWVFKVVSRKGIVWV